ncbi:metallophosphoesterase family protein [Candidatus Enterococcus ferrettii]|uniref:Calcineurin-like phosphoesterase domain-containing protein n=1 Tax=Candidatus Enterococcus ferrettii TaxID=2815324 RepID=A0ABV0EST9_9ENTE|nr:metallophosphoesterase [Enterococcus sp. 665A]MBO1341528.1 metallophosphoesterase [Enterococcus sp. 665A]
MNSQNHPLSINQSSALSVNALPPELAARFDLYPENKRRPINKTLFKNDYFQLTCNMRDQTLNVCSQGDIVYSAIPYDTARNYIQRAAIQYLLHPKAVRQYIESHKNTLEKYLMLSIFQVTGKKVEENSPEVCQAHQAIFDNPLFEIQILGRLLQHDETGPLSANLAGKFLFSENVRTGISEYIGEYLNFVVQLTHSLPIMTDGRNAQLLDNRANQQIDQNIHKVLTYESDIKPGLELLPQEINQSIESAIILANQTMPVRSKPLLRSEFGKELAEVRKNYVAHSVNPGELESYFENVHSTDNTHLINVVSDMHTMEGKLPFTNKNFNILAGDASDSQAADGEIKGIYVIGNHDLVDVLPINRDFEDPQWEKWRPFLHYEWFETLLQNPDDSWPMLPIGHHDFYEIVKEELQQRFPQMQVLNNSSCIHEGVRYIGLTIPVVLVKRKKEQQQFILASLKALLQEDHELPTVIVSHAPLFNELSMLTPKSEAYNKEYHCSEAEIEQLFETYKIIGAIHGHHHIPASSRRYQFVTFAGRKRFVVCSIYSKINTGLELTDLLSSKIINGEQ